MNYFGPRSAAERYAKGRPYIHPQVIDKIKAYLAVDHSFNHAIDVGCGTGLSTIALKEIARHIIGTDISAEMIALAPNDPMIEFYVAPAENLPVKDDDFDLMTLSSVFHWIDRGKFFEEARRVLRSQGWLIIYDNYFFAHMIENDAFQPWYQSVFLEKYPSPPRNRAAFSLEDSKKEGFDFLQQEEYQNVVRYTVEALINYLTTQSNIIAVVENGDQSINTVSNWLTKQIHPLFMGKNEVDFIFGGPIWYLRKSLLKT